MTTELRRLEAGDRPLIRELFAHDGGYSTRVDGQPASEADIDELLASRPAGLDIEKVSFGLFDDGCLAAVADIVRGWPTPDIAYVGLLQVDARRHGQGWGRITHDHLSRVVTGWPEVTRTRLGVVDTNRQVLPFWHALGYQPTGDTEPWSSPSGVQHSVDILERAFAAPDRAEAAARPR